MYNLMGCVLNTVGWQQWLRQLHENSTSWETTSPQSTRFTEWRDRQKPTSDKSALWHRDRGI